MSFDFNRIKLVSQKKDIDILESLLKEKYISENQIIQIYGNSFSVGKESSDYSIKTATEKVSTILQFLKSLPETSKKNKKLNDVIKRLMSNNGIETINEIICHIGLTNFFHKYEIAGANSGLNNT